MIDYFDWIGKKVVKKSGKPFKSTLKENTVKDVVEHVIVEGKLAFLFEEDDSYVMCSFCQLPEDSYLYECECMLEDCDNPIDEMEYLELRKKKKENGFILLKGHQQKDDIIKGETKSLYLIEHETKEILKIYLMSAFLEGNKQSIRGKE